MATGWNGSGVFTRGDGTREGSTTWAQAKAAAQLIDAPPHDTHDEILANGIEACLAKNGENACTGDLNLGSQNITGVGTITGIGSAAVTFPNAVISSANIQGATISTVGHCSAGTFGCGSTSYFGGTMDMTTNDIDDVGQLSVNKTIATGLYTGTLITLEDIGTTQSIFINKPSTSGLFVDFWLNSISSVFSVSALGNVISNGSVTCSKIIIGPTAPSSASDTGVAGTIAYDADYIYACTATNTWKRSAISTW